MVSPAVKENDRVILKKDNNSKVFKVILGRKFNFCKEKFFLDNLVGEVYGASYRLDGGQLVRLSMEEINAIDSTNDEQNEVEAGDKDLLSNRNLLDQHTNQKMKKEEIEGMKSKGVSAETIVEQLIKNSATFEDKTEFSKQKYIKRKTRKHLTTFTLLECNTRNLLEMYYNKGPTKICNLRMDSLAQVLNGANVRVGGRYVVVDGCAGLVTGALLERLDGNGLVVNLYTGSAPSRPAVDLAHNFSEVQLKILKDFPITQLNTLASVAASMQQLQQNTHQQQPLQHQQQPLQHQQQPLQHQQQPLQHHQQLLQHQQNKDQLPTQQQQQKELQPGNPQQNTTLTQKHESQNTVLVSSKKEEDGDEKMDCADSDVDKNECDDDDEDGADDGKEGDDNGAEENVESKKTLKRKYVPSSKRGKRNPETLEQRNERRMKRKKELNEVKEIIEEGKMDGLIICNKTEMTHLTLLLLPLLKPGRPIVVFSPYREPLVDCYVALKDSKQAVMLNISETWLRQYQVLENRTHPLVNMSGSGGCILTAIKVIADP